MAQIDSLLRLAHKEGADELRLGVETSPSMFSKGVPKKLTIPPTSAITLRHLLGEIVNDAALAALAKEGTFETVHAIHGVGDFKLKLRARPGTSDYDATFLRVAAAADRKEGPKTEASRSEASKAESANAEPPKTEAPRDEREPSSNRAPPTHTATSGVRADASPTTPESAPFHLPADVRRLVARARAMRASDLHLMTGEAPTVRVDGRLSPLYDEGPIGDAFLGLDAAMTKELRAGRSVDLALSESDALLAPRMRLNVYATSRGPAAAIRLLPPEPSLLGELGLPLPLDELAHLPNGLVIVCGPTGSGKSTTLASIAREALDRRSVVAITLEDPIEFQLRNGRESLVRQRQVGRDVVSFASGLRDALREDPDIVLVGEMRDEESISLALTAAETGHLVLTTLHARSAAAAIERIVDACPANRASQIRGQLADSLRAIVAQRLLPTVSGHGRAVALEVMRNTTGVASSIREGKTGGVISAIQSGRKDGMLAFERSLADLVRRGTVTRDVAMQAASDKETFARYLAG